MLKQNAIKSIFTFSLVLILSGFVLVANSAASEFVSTDYTPHAVASNIDPSAYVVIDRSENGEFVSSDYSAHAVASNIDSSAYVVIDRSENGEVNASDIRFGGVDSFSANEAQAKASPEESDQVEGNKSQELRCVALHVQTNEVSAADYCPGTQAG